MTGPRKKASQAGGFLVAAGMLVGTVGGVAAGQPSAGFLIGLGAGLALALFIWWRDRS